MKKVKNLFSTESMYLEEEGDEPPSNKEAYGSYFRMAWPCIIESLLVCAVNVIDTIMVGTLGEAAIAAVGITTQPRFLLLALIISINMGVTAVVARRKGEENRKSANAILKGTIFLSIMIGILMAFLGIIFARQLMIISGAESNYLNDAVIYFRIISFGLFFQIINLAINAAQRGAGYTKITMITNTVANVVNIVFNYILINGKFGFPRLEIIGAGIATSFGAFVACVIAVIMLCNKKGYLNIYDAMKEKLSYRMYRPVFVVGSGSLVEQYTIRLGFIAYGFIVAKLGTIAYATHLICMTILNLSFSFGDGISVAAATLVGQELGRRNKKKAQMYVKIGQRMAFLISTVLFVFYLWGRNVLVGFYSDDLEVIKMGANIMIIMAFTTHIQTSQVVYSGCLRGAGDSKYVAKVSIMSVVFIRPAVAYLLCFVLNWGIYGAWGALLLDQSCRLLFGALRIRSGEWSKIEL